MPDARAPARSPGRRRASAGESGVGVPLVVGAVVLAVGRVQLAAAGRPPRPAGRRRQVEHQRPDLGAQEVVRAGRAQRGQPRDARSRARKSSTDVGVGEVPDLRAVGGGQPADHRGQRGGPGPALGLGQRLAARTTGAERLGAAVLGRGTPRAVRMISSELRLALLAGRAPGGDAVAAEDARRSPAGWPPATAAMSRPSWKPGPPPRHPGHPVAEALPGQRLAVGGGGERDAGVGVQVVDVRRRRPGRAWRCRWTAPRRPCRAGSSRTRRPSRPRARRPGRRRSSARSRSSRSTARPAGGQRAEVAAGALDPQQLDRPRR